jgi:HD domain
MKDHTTCGERICSGMKMLADVLPIIRSHHERWDGSGYPDGLRRNEILLARGRIVQVADIYDALTTDRPYKPAFSSDYAINVLREEAKTGWRDARIVDAFCEAVPLFHDAEVGSNSSLLALSSALEKNGVGVAAGGIWGPACVSGAAQRSSVAPGLETYISANFKAVGSIGHGFFMTASYFWETVSVGLNFRLAVSG